LVADILTAGVLVGIVGLIIRRLFIRSEDFEFAPNIPLQENVRPGILRDSSIVAGFIVLHVGSRLLFKATQLARDGADGFHPVSSWVAASFAGAEPGTLILLNHFFWW
jgi:hypothetical protein